MQEPTAVYGWAVANVPCLRSDLNRNVVGIEIETVTDRFNLRGLDLRTVNGDQGLLGDLRSVLNRPVDPSHLGNLHADENHCAGEHSNVGQLQMLP
jgi:hypothetical protein